MPTFDITSELDMQEVKNAVDQANREIVNRFDFKGTDSTIDLTEEAITMESANEDRLAALRQVVEEKFVKRKLSLKGLEHGTVQDASGGRARQVSTLAAGINQEKSRELNKFIKGLGRKGVSSQNQGEQLRVQAKKRDDLQEVIAALKAEDFGIPLQFGNFRDK